MEAVVSEKVMVVILTGASSGIGEATEPVIFPVRGIICLSVPDVWKN